MTSKLSSGQLTLTDLNDAIVAGTAPVSPTTNQLWVDTSVNPNLIKKWDGTQWVTLGEVASTGTSSTATNNNTTLGNMANDNIIDITERQDVKDKLTGILGFAIADTTTTLPTTTTLDSGSATDNGVSVSTKGTFYSLRKQATNAGLSTSDGSYTGLVTQYNALKTYLEGLTPVDAWDVSSGHSSSNITVTKSTWRTNWLNYYNAEEALAQAIALKLKQNVDNVTISGRNMLRNTALETDTTYFAPSTGVTRDTSTLDGTANTFKWVITGKASDLWSADNPSQIACKTGDIVSASVDIYIPTGHGIDVGVPTLEIQWFDSTGARITTSTKGSSLSLLDQWQRLKLENVTAPANAVHCNARVWLQRNGSFWDGKLKLEFGSKCTDWTPALEDNANTIYNAVFNVNKQNIISSVTSSSQFNNALTTGQGDFVFNNGSANWTASQGGTTPVSLTSVQDANYGANSIQITGEKWLFYGTPIPVDTARVYQVKFRVKQTIDPTTSGKSKVYAGVASFDANKANLTASTYGTHRYCAVSGQSITVADGWQEFTGKISGEGVEGYDQFVTGTKYAVPMFIVNYAGGDGTALVDCCILEDITDTDTLANRVSGVEQSLTSDGITTVLTQSTFYQNYKDDMKGKADSGDLSKYALGTALDTTNENLKNLSDTVDGIDLTKYATTDYVDETSTHLTTKFSASGGMNLLKNSIGFSDFISKTDADNGEKNWFIQGSVTDSIDRVTSIQTTELDTLGFGSGFQWQGVPVTPTTAPTLALVTNASSTLTAVKHYVKYTWVSATGESIPSPEANYTVVAGNNLKVTIPTFPTGVTSANIYVSTTAGSEKYQTVISTSGGNVQLSSIATNTTAIPAYQNASIDQYVNVIPNQTYTLSWYVSKTNSSLASTDDGALRFFLYEYGQSTQINVSYPDSTDPTQTITGTEYKYTSDTVTNGYDIKYITFTPATNKVQLRIYGHSMFSGIVTGLMFTIGDVALQWSLATGESFNTNVRLDINGIRVSQLTKNSDGSETEIGYTSITPSEFAGWYDTNGDGTFEKVFYLNGDETVTKKLTATDEITMGSVKIINVTTGGYNGWAFVPSS